MSTDTLQKIQDKTARIAIIGAGPSGLGAAEALREQGFKNVTVFEKNNRVGGMCLSHSYQPKDKSLPAVPYDLGSVQPIGSKRLLNLIKAEGLHLGKDVVAKKPCKFRMYSLQDKAFIIDFLTYKMGYPVAKMPLIFLDALKLLPWMIAYRRLSKPGFSNVKNVDKLAVPFNKWIKERKFFVMDRLIYNLCAVSLNLGLYSEYVDCSMIYTFKNILRDIATPPATYLGGNVIPVKEGYQEVWNRVAKRHNVVLDANIIKIERHEKITLEFDNQDKQEFDYLIIACAPQNLGHMFSATKEEKTIFSEIKHGSGWRVAFIAKNLPIDAGYVLVGQSEDPTLLPAINLFNPEGYVGDNKYLFSAVIASADVDGLAPALERSVHLLAEHFKATDIEWIDQAYWPEYNSHFSSKSIVEGIFDKFEAIQGQNKTFYVGEILSGQTNGVCMDYAYNLVERFFVSNQ
jgi:oxygen-dependent protoporphyrinogen oxidase